MIIKRIKSLDTNLIKIGEKAKVLDISDDGEQLTVLHSIYGEYTTLLSDWEIE